MAEVSFQQACDKLNIPEAFRKHIDPESAPEAGRMAVARGLLPAPAKTLLSMQYFLLGDVSKKVARAAKKTLSEIPTERLSPLLGPLTHAKILEFFVYDRLSDHKLMEQIVLSRQINDKSICYLAELGPPRVVEIVANNQERLIITPQILRFLRRNENATKAILDKVATFQRLHEISVPEESPEELEAAKQAQRSGKARAKEKAQAEAHAPEPVDDPPPPSVEPTAPVVLTTEATDGPTHGAHNLPRDFVRGEVYLAPSPKQPYEPPPGLINPLAALLCSWGIELRPEYVAPPPGTMTDTAGPPILGAPPSAGQPAQAVDEVAANLDGMETLAESTFNFDFAEGDDEFGAELTTDSEGGMDDEAKLNLAQYISSLNVGNKIKLAYKGNKEVRDILIRERNKMVATAVVKGGRMTDGEILSCATNRSIQEDVLRLIADDPENVRKYQIKLALCNNPKTPVPIAMRFLKTLLVGDLKAVSKNRNVSSVIFSAAAKMYKRKKGG